MAVNKQTVKSFLETETELSDRMKEAMDDQDNWKDFKNEFINLIVQYSKQLEC